jgi:DHA3 family tetracycline resistance protein-like MFS transporter
MRGMESQRFYLFARCVYALAWTNMVTVNLVFMVEVAGLDPLQMVLVGTVLELSVFLFEIPTGVVADRVSRRLSVIVGHFLIGVGFLVIVLVPTFEVILLSQVVWGIGWTFISGAYPAWLTSEVGVQRANETMLRASQLSHGVAFVGIGLAIALAHVSLALPIAVGALTAVGLSVAMLVFMREDHFEPASDAQRETWTGMRQTFMAGVNVVRAQQVLILMLLITAVVGMFSEGLDRLFTPHLLERFEFPALAGLDTVAWWGVIAAVGNLAGLLATTLARRHVDLSAQQQLSLVLAGCLLGIAIGVLLLANLNTFYGVLACFWLVGALRSAYGPLLTAWLNRLFPDSSRATLFSLYGQADAAGQVMGGPVVGVLARQLSIGLALSVSAFMLLPALPLYGKIARVFGARREEDRD